jgi:hypothetical protein
VVIELAALRADRDVEDDPQACWADSVQLGYRGACGDTDTDTLGLCAYHRAKLFGEPLTREPDTAG